MEKSRGKMKWQADGTTNPLESRPELFNAALNAFSSHSFGEASLNEIIKAAGLNKGSFYYRFYDKTDLYLSLLYKLGMEKVALFKQYDDENENDGFYESIKKKTMLGLRIAKKDPRYNAFVRRIRGESADMRSVIRESFGGVTQDVLTNMIDDGKAKRQIRNDISTQLAAAVFSTVLDQIDIMISPTMDDADILQKVDELICILKDGMGARKT